MYYSSSPSFRRMPIATRLLVLPEMRNGKKGEWVCSAKKVLFEILLFSARFGHDRDETTEQWSEPFYFPAYLRRGKRERVIAIKKPHQHLTSASAAAAAPWPQLPRCYVQNSWIGIRLLRTTKDDRTWLAGWLEQQPDNAFVISSFPDSIQLAQPVKSM